MKVPVKVPINKKLLVKAGQKVDFTTPFFEKTKSSMVELEIAKTLDFPPDKIFRFLKKVIGDSIKAGDLLAEKKGILSTKQFNSNITGIIREINHLNGNLVIELDGNESSVELCFFAGEIDNIEEEIVTLNVEKVFKADTAPFMGDLGAKIHYHVSPTQPISEEDVADRFIFISNISPLDHAKIEALGAKAYITNIQKSFKTKISQLILQNVDDYELILKEQFPFCISSPDLKSIFFYK